LVTDGLALLGDLRKPAPKIINRGLIGRIAQHLGFIQRFAEIGQSLHREISLLRGQVGGNHSGRKKDCREATPDQAIRRLSDFA